ncbi:hypothetical protein TeGR_g2780 [Tetraparma gracilis]|uniref:Uncharacterized protein n=1 Tax=Tetraparma gracilis TaxID=2962635 RepID=A0ABQ6N503_9STRA|nr:hypothetical protein TeGR_g2780 [Tetraparma gracilis]
MSPQMSTPQLSALFASPDPASATSSLFSPASFSASSSKRSSDIAAKLSAETLRKRRKREAATTAVSCASLADAPALVAAAGVAYAPSALPASVAAGLLPAASAVRAAVERALAHHRLPFLPKDAEADPEKAKFSFAEVSSRCSGRLDVKLSASSPSPSLPPFDFSPLSAAPALLSAAAELLGADYVLAYAGLIFSYPGSADQPFHQDGHALFPEGGGEAGALPCYALNVFLPLHALSEAHGPTQFFPGSHQAGPKDLVRTDIEAAEKRLPIAAPILEPGDALAYDYRSVHRGTANKSGERLHLMRHGEGVHNAFIADRRGRGLSHHVKLHEAPEHPHLVDPSLTTLGENEAVSAQAITSSLAPKLLVTSPLRRAVQTARIAFKRVWADPAVPKVAHESAREGYGTGNVYDMRRPAAEVAAEFDNVVDFAQIQPGARDAMFEAGETDAGLVARGADMMQWLAGREEDEIAVVCHSKFLFALMNGVVEAPEGSLLRGWFDTAEVRSVDCYVVKVK